MLKRLVLLVAAAAALAGCDRTYSPTNNITATPTATPTPVAWLTRDPYCAGTITRGEWLVCDNATLNDLHRRLAAQWEAARLHASQEMLNVQEDQLYALLSERSTCQDAACIATAYRRYLTAPPPPPAKPPVVKPKPKPKPKPRPNQGGWGKAPWRDGLQGCQRDIGWDAALALSRRCSAVSRGANSLCSPQRSCATLENIVDKGCRTSRNPPGFCPR